MVIFPWGADAHEKKMFEWGDKVCAAVNRAENIAKRS
jgi:hypothetical protein